MGIIESHQEKIAGLIRDLEATEKTRRETAIALLTLMGSRAVIKLHELLEHKDAELRCTSTAILEQIGDSRSIKPLLSLLEDPDGDVRSAAAKGLACFDDPVVISPLIQSCRETSHPGHRMRVVTTLLPLAMEGEKDARAFILERLLDRDEDLRIRLLSMEILHGLKKRESRDILAELEAEDIREITEKIEGFTQKSTKAARPEDVRSILAALASSDYFTWHQALERIRPGMTDIPDLLLAELSVRGGDANFCQRIEKALLKFGPTTLASIHAYFEKETRPGALESYLNLLRRFSSQSSIPYLRGCLRHLNASLRDPDLDQMNRERVHFLKCKVHETLASLNNASEKKDLLEMVEERDVHPNPLLLQAAGEIGDRRFLVPLMRLFSEYLELDAISAEAIKSAFLKIAAREKVRATHKMFKNLEGLNQQVLFKIFI